MSVNEQTSASSLDATQSTAEQESSPTIIQEKRSSSLTDAEILELLELKESMKRKAAGFDEDQPDTSAQSAPKRQKIDGECVETSENPFLAAASGSNQLMLTDKMRKMKSLIAEAISREFPDYKWVSIIINMPGLGMPGGRSMPVNIFTSDAKNAAALALSWGEQIIPQLCNVVVKRWGGQKAVSQLFLQAHPKGSGDPFEGMDWAYTKTFAALSKGEGITNVVAHCADPNNQSCHLHVLYGYTSSAFNGTQLAKALTCGQLKPWNVDKHVCSDPALALMNHMEPRTTGVWLGATNLGLGRLAKMVYDSLKAANISDIPEDAPGAAIEDEVDPSIQGFLAPTGSQTSGFTSYQVDNLLSSKTEKFAAKLDLIYYHIERSRMEAYSLSCWYDYCTKLPRNEKMTLLKLTQYEKELVLNALQWYGRDKIQVPFIKTALLPCDYAIEDVSSVMEIILHDDSENTTWEAIYYKVITVLEGRGTCKRNTLWIYGPSNFGKSSVFVDGLSWLGPIARFSLNKVSEFQFGNLTHPHVMAVSDDPSGCVVEPTWPTLKAIFAGQSTDANEKYDKQAKTYPAPVMCCSNSPTIDLQPAKTLDVEAFNNRMLHINLGSVPCLPECVSRQAQHLLWKWAFFCYDKVKSSDAERSIAEFITMLHHVQTFMLFVYRLSPSLQPQVCSLYNSKTTDFLSSVGQHYPPKVERHPSTTDEEEGDSGLRSGDEGESCDPDFICDPGLSIEHANEP